MVDNNNDSIEQNKNSNNELEANRTKLIDALSYAHFYIAAQSGCDYKRFKTIEKVREIVANNSNNDFFSFSKRKFSFAKNANDPYNKRVETTLGRYVRRNLAIDTDSMPDNILDQFALSVCSRIIPPDESQIVLLKGEDITKYYKNTKITSCMTGKESYRTELYALNPDKINLVVYKKKVRALLWRCDDGSVYLDRVYPSNTKECRELLSWALYHKYIVDSCHNYADDLPNFDHAEHNDRMLKMSVTVKANKHLPYMDSFGQYLKYNKEDKTITLCHYDNAKAHNFGDDDDDGRCHYVPWIHVTYCDSCSEQMLDEEAKTFGGGESYCKECFDEFAVTCDECKRAKHIDDCEALPNDDEKHICNDCYDEKYTDCCACGSFYKKDEFVNLDGYLMCKECAKEYKRCKNCNVWCNEDDLDKGICGSCKHKALVKANAAAVAKKNAKKPTKKRCAKK